MIVAFSVCPWESSGRLRQGYSNRYQSLKIKYETSARFLDLKSGFFGPHKNWGILAVGQTAIFFFFYIEGMKGQAFLAAHHFLKFE